MLISVVKPFIRVGNIIGAAYNRLDNWWFNICDKGGEKIIDEREREKFRNVNSLGYLMVTILTAFIFLFHFYILNDFRITTGIILYTAFNLLAVLLNRIWHKHNAAAIVLYGTTCVAVAYFGVMMGQWLQLQFMIFFLMAILFQVFNQSWARVWAMIAAFVVVGILEYSYRHYGNFVYLDPIRDADKISLIKVCAVYSVFFIVLLSARGFVKSKDQNLTMLRHNRQIKDYMAHITHEMRSPINAIGMLSKKIHAEVKNNVEFANLEGYSEMLNLASANAQQVISNVLTFSEIEAGNPEPNLNSTFNLKQFFTKTVSMNSILAQTKQIRINLLFDQIPSLITSDPHKISHIVNNLLSNAIKFGAKKSTITILVSTTAGKGSWSFEVKNQGKAIPADKMDKIFDPFIRGVNGTLVPESSGLGLFITRNKVRCMNGEIYANSQDGFTTFTVHLPLQLGKLKEVNEQDEDIIRTKFGGARILIAEDDALNARALSISLETLDCKVEIAENGKELLAKARTNPDLIIMDYHMPLMNGETAIRLLKGDPKLSTIPVVVTTGDVYTDSLDRLLAAGADDYILKPIEHIPLTKVLSRFIGVNRPFSESSRQEYLNGQ